MCGFNLDKKHLKAKAICAALHEQQAEPAAVSKQRIYYT